MHYSYFDYGKEVSRSWKDMHIRKNTMYLERQQVFLYIFHDLHCIFYMIQLSIALLLELMELNDSSILDENFYYFLEPQFMYKV